MEQKIEIREYQRGDRDALADVIRKTWDYDGYAGPKTAEKMGKAYLESCLADQTFTRVAVVDGKPVGIIMGKNTRTHKCPFSQKIRLGLSLLSLLYYKEGRRMLKLFGGINRMDEELLTDTGRKYQGEVAFFALRSDYRGLGLGGKLFQSVVEYMKNEGIEDFYLFTDTTCNYGFYEHFGMKRRGKKEQAMEIRGKKEPVQFFLYEYRFGQKA